ncbi:MAG: hydantoinase B/oxoprolinase family protein [Xanthomonadales bacterium]|nr:hydantoinase B/oxoprolinase family protein [Xanthomonadales bacterium]
MNATRTDSPASLPDAATRIELGLFASRVAALCEEMGALLGRTAFSPNIRDRLDYSCAAFDASGALLGQATHIPVHLGSMAHAMGPLAESRRWRRGDLLAVNDPFQGGTHLPDITLISPAFVDGTLVGFCANRAHHADIGAEAPGSMPVSTRLEQEGVLIPPTLVGDRDGWRRDVLDGLLAQLRDGEAALGDFSAQAAANRLGVQRLEALAAQAADAFRPRVDALQAYGERLARDTLAGLPAGVFTFEDWLDDDGAGTSPIRIVVTLEVDGRGGVRVGFDGTAPQVPGNLNCPFPVTVAAVTYVFRCLMPDQVPACAGAFRPLEITAPAGCLVNARPPAAVAAGNVETSMRIVDAVCGALAKALPGRLPAASQGTMNNLALGRLGAGGWDYYETLAGGMGAGPDHPGNCARHSHMTNTLNTPVEVLERHTPLRIERYAVRRGSGGAGRLRGGDGVERVYRFLADASLSVIAERRLHAPWGLEGGAAGAPGRCLLDDEELPPKCERSVRAGQRLRVLTPGGGGHGDPATAGPPSDGADHS